MDYFEAPDHDDELANTSSPSFPRQSEIPASQQDDELNEIEIQGSIKGYLPVVTLEARFLKWRQAGSGGNALGLRLVDDAEGDQRTLCTHLLDFYYHQKPKPDRGPLEPSSAWAEVFRLEHTSQPFLASTSHSVKRAFPDDIESSTPKPGKHRRTPGSSPHKGLSPSKLLYGQEWPMETPSKRSRRAQDKSSGNEESDETDVSDDPAPEPRGHCLGQNAGGKTEEEVEYEHYEDNNLLQQLKGRPRDPSRPFNLLEAFMGHGDLLTCLVAQLDCDDFLKLYCVSRDFHEVVDRNMRVMMVHNAQAHFGTLYEELRWTNYRNLLVEDPLKRPSFIVPDKVRRVPSFRWLAMLTHRCHVVQRIVEELEVEGLSMPPTAHHVLLKLYPLLDNPQNAYRMARVNDRRYWANEDVYVALMIFMRLDMCFNDPVEGGGGTRLRTALMYQKSLDPLLSILLGRHLRSKGALNKFWARTLQREYNVPAEDPTQTPFSRPAEEFGMLTFEYWGRHDIELVAPDELLLRVAYRRNLGIEDRIPDLLLSGFSDSENNPILPTSQLRAYANACRRVRLQESLTSEDKAAAQRVAAWSLAAVRHQMEEAAPHIRYIMLATERGEPLCLEDQYFLHEMDLVMDDYSVREVQKKQGTGKPLSNRAREAESRRSLAEKMAARGTSTNRYSTAGLTPEETQLMMRQHILPLICQTAGQGFSRDALHSIRTQNVTHLLHRLRYTSQMTPDALTPYEVSLLRSSTILLARSQNPQASGGASVAGRAHVVHHAIHKVKRKLRQTGKFDELTEAEQILALTHLILPYFQQRMTDGQALTFQEMMRLRNYGQLRKDLLKVHAALKVWKAAEFNREVRMDRIQKKIQYLNHKRSRGLPLEPEEESWRCRIINKWRSQKAVKGVPDSYRTPEHVRRTEVTVTDIGYDGFAPEPVTPGAQPNWIDQALGEQDKDLFTYDYDSDGSTDSSEEEDEEEDEFEDAFEYDEDSDS